MIVCGEWSSTLAEGWIWLWQELKFGGGKEECLKLWQADGVTLQGCLGLETCWCLLLEWLNWKVLNVFFEDVAFRYFDGSLYLKYPYNNNPMITAVFPTIHAPRPVLFSCPPGWSEHHYWLVVSSMCCFTCKVAPHNYKLMSNSHCLWNCHKLGRPTLWYMVYGCLWLTDWWPSLNSGHKI